jgi:hypothetical protein
MDGGSVTMSVRASGTAALIRFQLLLPRGKKGKGVAAFGSFSPKEKKETKENSSARLFCERCFEPEFVFTIKAVSGKSTPLFSENGKCHENRFRQPYPVRLTPSVRA